ncbi:hypothetical protein FC40_GL000371 [Ligilactobacillus hayakitensis DSM 18933 = JCM 14209]|uniref:Glycosyltransferase n=1 Tax=Ligilactobacillus hayakitensis DSM 18933 = JCM 14209 TaxID=1423755 RepID=A0A0R1WZH4_9LACO|nr:glycosyltransferase [Ligilactobacillus hayakitensis]KRM20131.1 hypothetical protein FC40_GL000371 [Ligilactobacillus hayakitensis DSM 18933 = JCM 14209]
MKKKVAFLIMNMDKKGGTERVTSMISNSLSKKLDVYIFSCQNGKTPYFHVNKNVQVESLHGERIKNSILRKIYVFNNLYNRVKKNNIDIVIAVDVALFLYLLPLKALNVCKCISWEHFNYFINPIKMGTNFIEVTGNTVAIHHYEASWYTGNKKIKKLKYFLIPIKQFIKYQVFWRKLYE